MKVFKIFLLFLLSIFILGVVDASYEGFHRLVLGKSSYSSEAVYKVPNSTVEIVLERRAVHLFLAEYERTLVLRIGAKELIRKEAAVDTGGYCRMNVYQTEAAKYFLAGDLSFDKYFLDIDNLSFTEDVLAVKHSSAKFVGAFDRDEKGWRFIPVYERGEQKSKIEQYGGIQ